VRDEAEEQRDDPGRRNEKAIARESARSERTDRGAEDEKDERPTCPWQERQSDHDEPKGNQHNHRGIASKS
jgi:hypothetical protein